ncbi:Alkaline ceramidase 3 [Actinomortierella ambigua]|nr:Alkaline ceramidase 3 [Actinomortierella ambigua]
MPPSDFDKLGYWSPTTSSVDWCENNYVVSYYIAEFWNSFSSLFIIAIAIAGAYLCPIKEPRLLLICGMGIWLPALLIAWLAIATAGASLTGGSIQFFSFHVSMVSLELMVAYTGWAVYQQQTKHRHNPDLQWLTRTAATSFLSGVAIWLIDLNFCEYTNGVSPEALLPFPLYLHAWWHVLSGIGSYMIIQATIYEHYYGQGLQPFVYMWKGFVPAIGVQHTKKAN